MTMNRRNALISGAVLAAGVTAGGDAASTAGQAERYRAQPSGRELTSSIIADVAAVASECAAASASCIDLCTERLLAGDRVFAELSTACRDCSDICSVTATVLARNGSRAPAICQACADACSRLAAVCRRFTGVEDVQVCHRLATRCANACRSLVDSSVSR